ncbi:MAG: phage tail sheath subtilisin-like domain-containing protein [Myxococcota bacterium]|nr:phage tail sheath subtilisin-like domain-containing protein [Myxococcota bacterium]
MKHGIIVQHGHNPELRSDFVRSDITAIIGFVPPADWPEGYSKGDFIEVVLSREAELWAHPLVDSFDDASKQGVRNYFVNGGISLHIFALCIESIDDLCSTVDLETTMTPLLERLREEEDISILTLPAAAYFPISFMKGNQVISDAENLYSFLLLHCREMNNRFLIIDPPMGLHGEYLQNWVKRFRTNNQNTSSYGALYYPWLWERDKVFPPSAAMAGVFVRVDLEHRPIGIHWPPANVHIRGVTHLDIELNWSEASELAEAHINPFVIQPGQGINVFGARTLSFDPAFQFINSRRILNLVVEQIRRDNLWAVFETHNPHLWNVLEREIRYRLDKFWSAGLLTIGNTGKKYEVTCGSENNPPAVRDAGYVNVEVLLQPVGATEMILIDLSIGSNT